MVRHPGVVHQREAEKLSWRGACALVVVFLATSANLELESPRPQEEHTPVVTGAYIAPSLHQEWPPIWNVVVPTPTPAPDVSREAAVRQLLKGKPLEKHAELLVRTSDEYGIDWHLLPALSVLESSGGSQACGGNAWGWGSCTLRPIASFEEGARVVAETLSGPPYRGLGADRQFCMWVSGHSCTGDHTLEYQAKGIALWARLDSYRDAAR